MRKTAVSEEIPFTKEAIKIYIDECEKRISQLSVYVSEYNKLKLRLKRSKERLERYS